MLTIPIFLLLLLPSLRPPSLLRRASWSASAVALVANIHFGMLPFIIVAACLRTAGSSVSSSQPPRKKEQPIHPASALLYTLPGLKPILTCVPVCSFAFLSPQPLAGIAYILLHSPVEYSR